MDQVEMVSLGELVGKSHRYRQFKEVWDFKRLDKLLLKARKDNPHEGYGISKAVSVFIIAI